MKERQILFSAPMVRALLDGSKTQTRRMVRLPVIADEMWTGGWRIEHKSVSMGVERFNRTLGKPVGGDPVICPYGQPGDRLWVRETWAPNAGTAGGFLYRADHGHAISFHKADLHSGEWTHRVDRWKPSIHMPRAASRILLEITGVRLEGLQDISEADAIAEGCSGYRPDDDPFRDVEPRDEYRELWESINGAGSWAANPWVWVIELKRATT